MADNESTKGKEQFEELEFGKLYPREFDKCPVCGCPRRFAEDVLAEEVPKVTKRPYALGEFEAHYTVPEGEITLHCVVDSCRMCGVIYTVARDKVKKVEKKTRPLIIAPRPGMPGFRLPFMGRG